MVNSIQNCFERKRSGTSLVTYSDHVEWYLAAFRFKGKSSSSKLTELQDKLSVNRNHKQALGIACITNKNMRALQKYILQLKLSLWDELHDLTAKMD